MKIVKTKTQDGLLLNGLYSESETKSKRIIIHVHGMAGSIVREDFFEQMHEDYPKNGIAFLAGENRGLGVITPFLSDGEEKFRTIGSALEKFEDCVHDIDCWVDWAISRGYDEIWLQGHSLGCTKIAYYLDSKQNSNIRGIVFLSPAAILNLAELVNRKELLERAKKLLKEGKENELLATNDWGSVLISAKTFINLFGHNSKLGIFDYSKKMESEPSIVNKIKLPVLAFTGTKDKAIVLISDPYKAMQKLEKELINSPRVKTVVYENAWHLFSGLGNKIVKEVLDFVGV